MPLDALVDTFGGCFALRLFDLGLLLCGEFVVALLDRLCSLGPQPLRLPLILFLERPANRGAGLGSPGIEEQLLVSSLSRCQGGNGPVRKDLLTHPQILDEHLLAPQPRELVENLACMVVLDDAANGVVRAADPALGLEVDVGRQPQLGAPHKAVVPKLILHLAKQNAPGVHVRLREDA